MPCSREAFWSAFSFLLAFTATDVIVSGQSESGHGADVVRTLFKNLGLCTALKSFDLEVCRERSRRYQRPTSPGGAFQPIAERPKKNGSIGDKIPWSFNKFVIKGNLKSPKTRSPASAGTTDPTWFFRTDTVFKSSLEISFDNVTYSVNDPTLPWKILEYFANLQIEVAYVENIEKRKLYSEYLFRKMNVYLYSVGGTAATIKTTTRSAISPEFFVDLVNNLSLFLVLMMTIMLCWFVGYLGYWYCRSQSESLTATSTSDISLIVPHSPRSRLLTKLRDYERLRKS